MNPCLVQNLSDSGEKTLQEGLCEGSSCSLTCIFRSKAFLQYLDTDRLIESNRLNFSSSFLTSHSEIACRRTTRTSFLPVTDVEKAVIASKLYTRLERDEIRLLRLLPSKFNDPLQCDLFQYKIGSGRKKYLALSYTWGKPQFTARILCDQIEFPITQNLADALQHIRHEHLELLIWVDALCINQCDLEEKTYQIPLMYDIYARAHQTLIWLGNGNEMDFVMVSQLRSISNADDEALTGCHYSSCSEVIVQMHEWLARFLQRGWFTRSWIRQEVAASQSCIILCGESSIHFDSFESGIRKFLTINVILPRSTASLPVTSAFVGTRFSRLLRHRDDLSRLLILAHNNAVQHCSISEASMVLPAYICREWYRLVLQGSIFAATDPRDKVFSMFFALQNALQPASNAIDVRTGKWVYTAFQISYTTSVSMVFQNFVKALINTSKTLEPLSFFRPSYRLDPTSELPTWVSDLRKPEGGCLAAGSVVEVGIAEVQTLADDFQPLCLQGTILGQIRSDLTDDPQLQDLLRVQLDDIQPLDLYQHENLPKRKLDTLWSVGQPMDHILSGMGYGMFEIRISEHCREALDLDSDLVVVQATQDARVDDFVICAYGGFHPFVIRTDSTFKLDNGAKIQQFCGPSVLWTSSKAVNGGSKTSENDVSKIAQSFTDTIAQGLGFTRWKPSKMIMNKRLLPNEETFHIF